LCKFTGKLFCPGTGRHPKELSILSFLKSMNHYIFFEKETNNGEAVVHAEPQKQKWARLQHREEKAPET
jgi:hypothetical protein